jgi:hypothetical protein
MLGYLEVGFGIIFRDELDGWRLICSSKENMGQRLQLPAPDLHQEILRAIREKRLIGFFYGGKERIAEPHDYGIQKGSVRLLSYQVGGQSNSGRLPAWRWIDVDRMSELQVLDRTFPGGRGDTSSQHHRWDKLFARVTAPDENERS